MTSAGMNIEQRSIVLLPFSFSNLTENKTRPALVISNSKFNKKSEDIICCLITSSPDAKGVKIANKDMESGFLKFESTIKPHRLFTADKKIIYKVIGKLNKEKTRSVIREIDSSTKIYSSTRK